MCDGEDEPWRVTDTGCPASADAEVKPTDEGTRPEAEVKPIFWVIESPIRPTVDSPPFCSVSGSDGSRIFAVFWRFGAEAEMGLVKDPGVGANGSSAPSYPTARCCRVNDAGGGKSWDLSEGSDVRW